MKKIMLSLADDLKDQMDAAKAAQSNISWSAVASEAFAAKLDELRWAALPDDVRMIAARVKMLDRAMDQGREQGFNDGRRWAQSFASSSDLRAIEAMADRPGWDRESDDLLCDRIARATGNKEEDGLRWNFWGHALQHRPAPEVNSYSKRPHEFYLGFVQGALSVWDKIKVAF